jgi:hypothetical protein
MKFSKVPVGSWFRYPNGRTLYVKTKKGAAKRGPDGTPKPVTIAADDELVVLPFCEVCRLIDRTTWEGWILWNLNGCYTCP